ncbi:MAG: hypothetical protein ACLRMN_04745 [Mediterraneibacter gnavus]
MGIRQKRLKIFQKIRKTYFSCVFGYDEFSAKSKKAVLTLLSLSLTGYFCSVRATVLRSVNVNNMAASSMYDDCNYTIMWEASPEELLEISRENPLTPELREKVLAVDGVKSIIPRTSSA